MIEQLTMNINLVGVFITLTSLLLVYIIIPKIIWVVRHYDMIDYPDFRSSHNTSTPTMGGVAFFITLMLMLFFLKSWDKDLISINLVASLTIIFSIGLKDDLVSSTPRAKLIGELVAAFFIILVGSMQVTSLYGFLGIYSIPKIASYFFLSLMIISIVNAYNLIDGIDGLASTIGIVIFSVYGFIFYVTNNYFYFLLCLSLIGILIGYLRYNFSIHNKIFMGDTGSLIIGFSIAFLTLKFLGIDTSQFNTITFFPENKPIIIVAILIIPIFDLFRVIGIRLYNKRSPFHPDKNHIHHLFIDLGFSHFQTTLLLGAFNYFMVILFFWLSSFIRSWTLLIILISIFNFLLIMSLTFKKKSNK